MRIETFKLNGSVYMRIWRSPISTQKENVADQGRNKDIRYINNKLAIFGTT